MTESRDPSTYYYSTYHLARDFIGTAAPFTLFLCLAGILLVPVRNFLKAIAAAILMTQSWVIGLLFVGIYVLAATMTGVIIQRIAFIFRYFWSVTRKKKVEFEAVYEANRADIASMYSTYISVPQKLHVHPGSDLSELVDRLCTYFKLFNPQGYNHLYREYTLASMYRQTLFYSLALAIACVAQNLLILGILFTAVAALMGLAISVTVKEVIRTEYEFMIATASWIDRDDAGPQGPKSGRSQIPQLRKVAEVSPNPTPAADG